MQIALRVQWRGGDGDRDRFHARVVVALGVARRSIYNHLSRAFLDRSVAPSLSLSLVPPVGLYKALKAGTFCLALPPQRVARPPPSRFFLPVAEGVGRTNGDGGGQF